MSDIVERLRCCTEYGTFVESEMSEAAAEIVSLREQLAAMEEARDFWQGLSVVDDARIGELRAENERLRTENANMRRLLADFAIDRYDPQRCRHVGAITRIRCIATEGHRGQHRYGGSAS